MSSQGMEGHCSAGGLTSVPLSKERKGGTRLVKHMGGKRREVPAGFWYGNLKNRDLLERLGLDGSIILKWISCMIVGRGLGSSGSGEGQIVGCCEILINIWVM